MNNERSKSIYLKINCGGKNISNNYNEGDIFECNLSSNNFKIRIEDVKNNKISKLSNSKLDYSKVNFVKCAFTKDNLTMNITNSSYDRNQISLSSLLGISYYLTKEEFSNIIKSVSSIIHDCSSIVFDYQTYEYSKETKTNEELAQTVNEEIKSKYSYKEIEDM